jgi:hypothetical protein
LSPDEYSTVEVVESLNIQNPETDIIEQLPFNFQKQ